METHHVFFAIFVQFMNNETIVHFPTEHCAICDVVNRDGWVSEHKCFIRFRQKRDTHFTVFFRCLPFNCKMFWFNCKISRPFSNGFIRFSGYCEHFMFIVNIRNRQAFRIPMFYKGLRNSATAVCRVSSHPSFVGTYKFENSKQDVI